MTPVRSSAACWDGACGPYGDNSVKLEDSRCMSAWEGSAGYLRCWRRYFSHFLLKQEQ